MKINPIALPVPASMADRPADALRFLKIDAALQQALERGEARLAATVKQACAARVPVTVRNDDGTVAVIVTPLPAQGVGARKLRTNRANDHTHS